MESNHQFACEGYARAEAQRGNGLSRRNLLLGGGMGLLAWLGTPRSALSQIALGNKKSGPRKDILVVIFMRGGVDGLSAVVPYEDDNYRRVRPSVAIAKPGQGGGVLKIDDQFGFHPAMASLMPFFEEGKLGVVHAVGSGDQTRSHFEAMGAMERGSAGGTLGSDGGWVARYLNATTGDADSPLRAVALSDVTPDSLLGATSAITLPDLTAYRLDVGGIESQARIMRELELAYGSSNDRIAKSGQDTLFALKKLDRLDGRTYAPDGGAQYPDSPFGFGMKQAAMLIKADVGLEIACLDAGGWDTHVVQGAAQGNFANLLADLSNGMSAFAKDLGNDMDRITVVAMTEFGRRLAENTGLGTDHGRASVFFALGSHVRGGKVLGDWPGLGDKDLEEPGDLRVTTDYRQLLAELLEKRTGLADTSPVFPRLARSRVGLFV